MIHFGILGAGNAGAALAAHLKLLGHSVSLYDLFPAALADIQKHDNTILLEGNAPVSGPATMDRVTSDLGEAMEGADILIGTTPAHIHKALAANVAPHLKSNQTVVLYPGRTGGALEFRTVLQELGGNLEALIVETQTIAYACRKTENRVNVFGYKQELGFSGLPATRLADFETKIQQVFPTWKLAPSIWHTSLNNIGMLFHPAPTLLNLGRMESGTPFDYYIDGFTPSIAWLVEQLDQERLAVAQAMGIELPSVQQWLLASYGCSGENLYQALQNNRSYVGIKAPMLSSVEQKLQLRYVIEDVPSGLVPFSALGERFGIPTPRIDAIIDLANAIYDADFRWTGRSLPQLGLADLSNDQIVSL